jgi:hypothetical protein
MATDLPIPDLRSQLLAQIEVHARRVLPPALCLAMRELEPPKASDTPDLLEKIDAMQTDEEIAAAILGRASLGQIHTLMIAVDWVRWVVLSNSPSQQAFLDLSAGLLCVPSAKLVLKVGLGVLRGIATQQGSPTALIRPPPTFRQDQA